MNFFKDIWNTIYFVFDGDIPLMVMGLAGIVMFCVYIYVVFFKR